MSLSTIRFRPSPPTRRGQGRRGEVLDPDARVEQLRLVAGDDQRGRPAPGVGAEVVEAEAAEVTAGAVEDLGAGHRPEPAGRGGPGSRGPSEASRRRFSARQRPPPRRAGGRPAGRRRSRAPAGGGAQCHPRHPPATSTRDRSQRLPEDLAVVVQPVRRVVERPAEGPVLVEVDQRDRHLDDRHPVRRRLDPDLQGHRVAVVGDLELRQGRGPVGLEAAEGVGQVEAEAFVEPARDLDVDPPPLLGGRLRRGRRPCR